MELPKKAWESWNIQAFVLISLSLQIILLLLAPFRKLTSNKFFNTVIWSAYTSADWAATFVVGLIGNYSSGTGHSSQSEDPRFELLAFWAPFLLLHLSGPDTITAFALEDNELWLRYLFGFFFQLIASVYILLLSLPENKLLIPILLMLLVGTARCAERAYALFLARKDNLSERVLGEYSDKGGPKLELIDSTSPQRAYRLFETFKGLVADQTFSIRVRGTSRRILLHLSGDDAFSTVQDELDFFYTALYTKFLVVASKTGCLLRFVSISSLIASLVIFILLDKQPFGKVDVWITYTLLVGAMALDIISFLMLVFSDWAKAKLLTKQIPSQRWSESVPQLNLLRFVKNQRVSTQTITNNKLLMDLILQGIKERAEVIEDAGSTDNVISSKSWLRNEFPYEGGTANESMRHEFLGVEDFDEIVLIWHTVTTLLHLSINHREEDKDYRQQAIILSDYMLYLLLMQPTLMLPVAGNVKQRFRGTCVHARKLSLERKLALSITGQKAGSPPLNLSDFLRENKNNIADLLGEGEKSVLLRVFSLADFLEGWFLTKDGTNKWERLTNIWIDLLLYAAYRSKGYSHAQQLCNGGQLISVVWLLMTQLGLSKQFN